MYLLDTNHCSAIMAGNLTATGINNNLIIVSGDRDFVRIKEAWNFPLENWLFSN